MNGRHKSLPFNTCNKGLVEQRFPVAAGAGRKESTVLEGRNRRCGRGESAPCGAGGAWGWGFVTPSGAAFGPPRGEASGRRPAGGSGRPHGGSFGAAAWGGRAGGLRGGTRSGGASGRHAVGGLRPAVAGRRQDDGSRGTEMAWWRREAGLGREARGIRFRVSGGNWPDTLLTQLDLDKRGRIARPPVWRGRIARPSSRLAPGFLKTCRFVVTVRI